LGLKPFFGSFPKLKQAATPHLNIASMSSKTLFRQAVAAGKGLCGAVNQRMKAHSILSSPSTQCYFDPSRLWLSQGLRQATAPYLHMARMTSKTLFRQAIAAGKGACGAVNERMKARPILSGIMITGCKTCGADILVQKAWEKKENIDWRRNAVFTIFGLGYLGGFQYILYNMWFPRWFIGNSFRAVAGKVAFDQTINTGVWYYPLFYIVQDAVMQGRMNTQSLYDGAARYSRNVVTDMTNCWKLWIPAQFINFWLVPTHIRVPYVAGISFVWTLVLSALRGDMKKA